MQQAIESALLNVIKEYGTRIGKYQNLAVRWQGNEIAIRDILWDAGAVSFVYRKGTRSRVIQYPDGSKIFVGALGELSWSFNFKPCDALCYCIEGGRDQFRKG